MKLSSLIKTGGIASAAYLLYVMSFSLFPYFAKKDLNSVFKRDIDNYDFYSDKPCVDRVALVEEPGISLAVRVKMISEATKTLDIAYYSLNMGKTTDYFLAAVLDAAERGVKVRILLDGIFNGFSNDYKYLAAALGSHTNIELKLYNTLNPLKPWKFNGRMHDKYIIIDNKLLLLGGRNIGDKYFDPDGYDKNLSIDRDVLIFNTEYKNKAKESSLFQVRNYMNSVWESKRTKLSFTKSCKKSNVQKAHLIKLMKEIREKYDYFFSEKIDYFSNTFSSNKITFFANDIDIYKKEPKVSYIIRHLLLKAKDKVFLQSPYVVLTENIETALREIGQKNVDYEILTNSMQSSPNLPAYSLYLNDRDKILKMNAQIYEFQNTNAIHAKTFIIDNRMSIVGSFNMDPRSEYIDTEIMLAIDSTPFTEYLQKITDMYKSNSLVVGFDGKYIENSDVIEFAASPQKRLMFKIIGKIISPLRTLV